MYLLDTNTCIYAINKKPDHVIEKVIEKSKKGIYISALTIAELEYGIENSRQIEKNRISLLKFLTPFIVINYDDNDAICYGKMKAKLKKTGYLFGPIDMLLASQALCKDLTFVTNNISEFSRVEGLQIEDWTNKN
ncbi:type II toxin-antitoxin system VapC family toxin [Candidatus Sumerlaeota bacterium]|nr:type II toxin-antitoxin system VapC family toxin [Candidatus Sumerlaeota bacterium]